MNDFVPARICSLLPSATEIVYALGLGDRLVGVTHECDYPPEARNLAVLTSSVLDHAGKSSREIHRHIEQQIHSGSSIYQLNQEKLEQLEPDLILTQELCTVCAVSYETVNRAVRLLEGNCKVVSLEPTCLEEIVTSMETVGGLTGAAEAAETAAASLRRRIAEVGLRTEPLKRRPTVFAMEWVEPLFAAGHWVPEMIRIAGGIDSLGEEKKPSATVGWERVIEVDPEVLVVMPCGFHLEETLRAFEEVELPAEASRISAFQNGRVFAVDGSSYFNRPGPRIVDGLEILAEILHPEVFSPRRQGRDWCSVPL